MAKFSAIQAVYVPSVSSDELKRCHVELQSSQSKHYFSCYLVPPPSRSMTFVPNCTPQLLRPGVPLCAHKDTLRVQDHFITVVIALPPVFNGGFIMRHVFMEHVLGWYLKAKGWRRTSQRTFTGCFSSIWIMRSMPWKLAAKLRPTTYAEPIGYTEMSVSTKNGWISREALSKRSTNGTERVK